MPVSFAVGALPATTIPWPHDDGPARLENTAGAVSVVRLRRADTSCVEPDAATSPPEPAALVADAQARLVSTTAAAAAVTPRAPRLSA
jgi:hypothetical protein